MNTFFTKKELDIIKATKEELEGDQKILIKYRQNKDLRNDKFEEILMEKISKNIFVLSSFNVPFISIVNQKDSK